MKSIIVRTALLFLFSAGKCYARLYKMPPTGKMIFENKCAKCHGKNGTKGLFGASNLQQSRLTDDQYFSTIINGKKVMPSWKKKLSPDEISQVINYIKTLRK